MVLNIDEHNTFLQATICCDAPGTEPTEPWIAAGPDVLDFIVPHYINHMNDIECEICEPICNISKPKHHRLCSSSSSPSILEHRFLWEAELLQHLPKPERHHLCNGHAWAWIQDDHSSKHTSNAKVRILSLFCTQKSRFWNAPAMWTSGTLLLRGCPHSVPALSRCPSL